MKKLGIDLDETIVDLIDPFLNYYNKETGTNFTKEDIYDYDIWKIINAKEEEAKELGRRFYISEHFDNLKPFEGAVDSIKKIKEYSELFIVTARYGIAKDKTQKWLDKHLNGLISEVFFTSDYSGEKGLTKEQICKKYSLDCLLDDDPNVALKCTNAGISLILFNRKWNQNINHEKIIRVNSWQEALRQINDLSYSQGS